MGNQPRLKEDYTLAGCCSPTTEDDIVGYYSHLNELRVHRANCPNLSKAEPSRLVTLCWDDILEKQVETIEDDDYASLTDTDFAVLNHHLSYGVDYSHIVARKLNISKQAAFDSHQKLRDMGYISRVEPRIIQYRKGVVDNKWIKHRNHTYYDLTDKGKRCLSHYQGKKRS